MSFPRSLAPARRVIGHTFDTTAAVMRKASVADSSGGSIDTYTLFATYPCTLSIFPIRPREVEYSERIQAIRTWQFAFPFDADVQPTDRLVTNSRTFEVSGSGHDSLNIVLLIVAQEII